MSVCRSDGWLVGLSVHKLKFHMPPSEHLFIIELRMENNQAEDRSWRMIVIGKGWRIRGRFRDAPESKTMKMKQLQ